MSDNILLFIFLFYSFIFLTVSTVITWLLSKKFPGLWLINKTIVGMFVVIWVTGISTVALQTYFGSLPSGVFRKSVGLPLPPEVTDLQAFTERRGDHEENHLTFLTNRETLDKILKACFYEIPKDEALEKMNSEENQYLKEFSGKSNVRYYERPSWDVGSCMSDFSDSYIAYDEESGKTYFQWNFNHF